MRALVVYLVVAASTYQIAALAQEPAALETAIADIAKRSAEIKSYSADFEVVIRQGGMEIKSIGSVRCRGELLSLAMVNNLMGVRVAARAVVDASGMTWEEIETMGTTEVTKRDVVRSEALQRDEFPNTTPGGLGGLVGVAGLGNDPREAVHQLGKMFDLVYSGKEVVGNEEVYVLTGTAKDSFKASLPGATGKAAASPRGIGAMIHGIRVIFSVSNGFPVRTEILDKSGAASWMRSYTNVRTNPVLDDTLFEYKPQAGVNVADETGSGTSQP